MRSKDTEETVATIKSNGRNAVALQPDLKGTGDLKRSTGQRIEVSGGMFL